ncbi:hypothetical protein K474DRAFT_484791 [Panus rudis PR-1116 ss-1]|nr:hypothetical protein K474DRAFT_484791 [Panus rudis PR-1116 ss-1]
MPLVAKLAWQHVDRKEDALIRTIRKSLNIENDPQSLSMLTHIVDMKCSLSLSTDSPHLHLPRAFMNKLPSLSYEDLREFRLLILEAYEPLENLTEVEDFKKVFLETFKAHHWVWTKAEVLHRDISVNNIMFRRRNGGVEGVLCDWDLAATKAYLGEPDPDDYTRVTPQEIEARRAMRNRPLTARLAAVLNSPPGPAAQSQQPHTQASTQNGANTDGGGINQEQSQPRPRYRTGTGPFMAFELLGNPPDRTPVHRYSFDAQSFFYVLVWMAVAHNPDKHKLGRIPEWIHPKLIDTFNAKSNFLNTEVDQNVILQRVRPPYTEWVMGLYEKVADAALAFMTIRRLRSNLIGAIVENNTQRIQSIRQTLKENVQKLENAITYEGFLEVLTSE